MHACNVKKDPVYKVITKLLMQYPKRTVLVLLCQLVGGLVEGLGIAAVLPVFSLLFSGEASDGLLTQIVERVFHFFHMPLQIETLLGFVIAAFLLKASLLFVSALQMGFATAYVARDLRQKLIYAYAAAKWPYFIRHSAGTQAYSVAAESQFASFAYTESCQLLAAGMRVMIYIFFAILVSWKVALAAMVSGGVTFLLLGGLVRAARRAAKRQILLLNRISSRLSDGLSGMKVLKAMGLETRLFSLLKSDIKNVMRAQRTVVLTKHGLDNMHEVLLVILVCSGMYVMRDQLAINMEVTAVLVLFFAKTLREVNVLQKIWHKIAECSAGYCSVIHKISEAEIHNESFSGEKTPGFCSELELTDVSFAYSSEQTILNQVNLSIPFGSMIAIIGPSGTGKTTLIDLIAGLLLPVSGELRVDGIPLFELDMHQWRRMIGYVQQENKLFHDTLLSNITMGEEQPDLERVHSALRMADAWNFISQMEEGIHTVAGEGGARLSGGQRQRIAIARALYHSQKLLLLDEITASLDKEAEAEICRVIASLKGKMTIVSISHQKGIVEVADCVYRLENGTLSRVDS
jgi:ATP-binding cassette, subfamily C, bacterial